MINERHAKEFCKDDISLIENYAIAIADKTQTWDCHHRLGTIENKTREVLKKEGRYFGVPAEQLIFLTQKEHIRTHRLGKPLSDETKQKLSVTHIGKHHTEISKQKLSASNVNNPKQSLQVIQFTTDGKFIAVYPSANEAHRQTNIHQGNISLCCLGKRKSAGGYIWKYKQ